ncbi:MAG TPA: kinase [Phycisphaerae bacterium]|nr:kinase [Phycisphaerae bacterium]
MIISRTPFRISFFGGGTDYPGWYREHGGAVLAATIDKYCYLTCRYLPPFFEHKFRIVYSVIENAASVEEIKHPAVREVLKFLAVGRGIEIHHDGDLPARSGMGSSSSFTVGLLHALHALAGRITSKHDLALQGIKVEQELLKEIVGSQDQVMAAYGGLQHVRFHTSGDIIAQPVTISPARLKELNSHLMLFYTGIKRTASDVASAYVANLDSRRRELRIIHDLVGEGLAVLGSGKDIRGFGELLHEGWLAKRTISGNISNNSVDGIYSDAREAGAVGGKLLGAGGGGFILLFVPPERQEGVKEKLDSLIHVPFEFEHSGSQIIFLDHEADYSAAEQARSLRPAVQFRELGVEHTFVPQHAHP